MRQKIVTKEEYKRIRIELKGKKVILCHGVFDLVHPGHIAHFEEAKSLGDVLVVSVTAAEYVRKGPGRPYFDDQARLHFLAAISCIDYVILSESYTVEDVIRVVEPDLYVEGQEYADEKEDITGKITEETELVRAHGGEVYFTSGAVYSSTRLINRTFPALTQEVKEYLKDFSGRHSLKEMRETAERLRNKRVLVVGDVIIDRYIYCHVQGLMSKDMGYSARFRDSEQYPGGAAAVARHAAALGATVTLLSVTGREDGYQEFLQEQMGDKVKLELYGSRIFPTIVKTRYLEKNAKREELHKIFAVNNIPEKFPAADPAADRFIERLRESAGKYDVILLSDFGHGLVREKAMEILQEKARFLALNCQTNSSNYGMNLITKYQKASVFALDERELKLAYPYYELSDEEKLRRLGSRLSCGGWLTRGSKGAYGMDREGGIFRAPALTLNVKDTIGAGDAFFAAAGLFAALRASAETCTFIGNVAGALMANITGNREPVEKVGLLKYAGTLLNI